MPKTDNKITHSSNLHQKLAGLINTTDSVASLAKEAIGLIVEGISISNSALVLYDSSRGILSFPFIQQPDSNLRTRSINNVNTPLKSVVEKQESLLVKAEDYLNYCGDKAQVKSIPILWAGYPIFKDEYLFAIIVIEVNNDTNAEKIRNMHSTLDSFPAIFSPYLEAKIRLDTLEGSEVKFRRFVQTSIDITFQITSTGYIDFVSSNVRDLFGCDPQSLVGKHFKVTTPMDQVSKVIEALKVISSGETIRTLGITQKVYSGELVPMEVNASPIYRDGDIIGAQGTMRDISERQKAQQEIERLAAFPLANPMPVVEVDLYGIPSYINPAGIQLLDRMNLDMAQVSEILPKKFKRDIRNALSDKGHIPSREVSLDGFDLLWSAYFLHNQNLLHYFATDITNLKNTENELISAKEIAVKNEQVKTLFLANMSHEIRTPLNSILGFTELIEEEVKGKFDEDIQAYFEIIHVSGKRLWQTVHKILDISQIETGTFDLKIESIDLGKILRDLGATYRPMAEEKNINLLVNVPNREMHIAADEYCTIQALTNLIDNAVKYTNSGYVKINSVIRDNTITVYIKDTGIGMSDEYQESMFHAFSQESTGYTKRFQGVGLGLALAQRFLELIQAKIELKSEQDVGSTFTIHFPINPDAPITESNPESSNLANDVAPPQPEKEQRLNILVVEDDPNSQKLAGFTLKKDFDLYFAESVAESKEILNTHKIQLILLDLSLKGDEDGLDLAKFLRNEPKWKDTPIIALTAHAFTSDRDRCIEAGCNDFMTKPFRRLELLEMIKNTLTG